MVALTDHGYIVLFNEAASKKAELRHDEAHKVYDVGEPYWNMRHHSGPDYEAWFLFETWETYLTRMMYVRVPESDVYDSPKGKKITIDIDGGRVTEMDGKWIRIVRKFYDGHESEVSGWVRWTDGRQMLVKPVAEVYY